MNYDKYLIFKNIRALLENSDVRLGNIESESHNQPGYMSRLEKADNSTEPNFEFIATAAKMLGVSLEALVFSDISKLNEAQTMLLKFLSRVLDKTRNEKIFWERIYGTNKYECKLDSDSTLTIEKYVNSETNFDIVLNSDLIFSPMDYNDTIQKVAEDLFKEVEAQTAEYRIKPQTRNIMTQFMNEKE